MKFEIPFNLENEYNEKLFLWKYTWIKKIRTTWFSLLLMAGLFLISLLIPENGFSYVILLATFLSAIISYIMYLISIERHKRKYLVNVKKRSERLIGVLIIYEFTDDCLIYRDNSLIQYIKWTEFDKFISSSDILMIKLHYQESYSHVISKRTFGDEAYFKIIDFLKTKLSQVSF